MKFIRVKCVGSFNSYRQPDFHTYHRTLPLPPKTTIAGMLGGALGISPEEVNTEWLKKERFKVGIIGSHGGKASDLWRIRKYTAKEKGNYFTAVLVRELLYGSSIILYLTFSQQQDLEVIVEKLKNPAWALSLGREDELIKITRLDIVDLSLQPGGYYTNTVLPFDVNLEKYEVNNDYLLKSPRGNLINAAPIIVKLPVSFTQKGQVREADAHRTFTFIGNFPIKPKHRNEGYWDEEEASMFQIF